MSADQDSDLSELSGESAYRSPRAIELNEVSLNGDADVFETAGKLERKGGFFRKRILVGRTNRDEKPQEVDLGKSVSVVFLKIRRKLVERADKGEIIRSTNEHNTQKDAVMLFDSRTNQSVRGVAADLRKLHEGLRTVQVVYALLLSQTAEPELVRLTVKGASLGSEAKAKEVPDFYTYIGSFPRNEHIWQYATELTLALEQGRKSYYAINFTRAEKLDEETLALAETKLKEVALNCREVDEARARKVVDSAQVEIVPGEKEEVAYPNDDINPDDIPF
jgi:hypothetical protein